MLPNNTNLSTFLIYTAAVVLVGSVVIPIWWRYGFMPVLFRQLMEGKGISTANLPVRIFTPEQLQNFDGSSGDPIYLAIVGKVYDVTKGKKHYGKGGSYSFFAGRDATRAFVSGNFKEDRLTDDIKDLNYEQYLGIEDWLKMYEKDYTAVGVLVGRFYNEDGTETDELKRYHKEVEMAVRMKEKDSADKKEFPECNSQWTPETGVIVWCSTESGGVKRSWEGLPRRYYKPGQTSFRCACVRKEFLDDPRVKPYTGCNGQTKSCHLVD